MKFFYIACFLISFFVNPLVLLAQSNKMISASEFSAKFVGNTITDKKCTFKLEKGGRISGSCQFTDVAATVFGRYNFSKQIRQSCKQVVVLDQIFLAFSITQARFPFSFLQQIYWNFDRKEGKL